MSDRLVIVARYKENLDWVNKLQHDFIIYNKGNDWPYEFKRDDVENQGREPETYLRAIIENYEKLNNYNFMAFLQGNPFDHCSDVLEIIDEYNDLEKYSFLSNTFGKCDFEKIYYYGNTSTNMIDTLLKGNYDDVPGIMKTLYLINFFGISLSSCSWGYSCGAQYIVPTTMILKKSKKWWIRVYEIYRIYNQYQNHDPSHMMEFLWPVLWIHQETE